MQQKTQPWWRFWSHQYIQRRDIRKFIDRCLNDISPQRTTAYPPTHPHNQPPAVVNIHGIGGIGKSLMLRQLFEEFQQRSSIVWWNFDRFDIADAPDQVLSWNEALIPLRQLPYFAQVPGAVCLRQKDGTEQEVNFHLLSEMVLSEGDHTPLLLLLDGVDDMDSTCWKWFQQYVIKPLIEQQDTLVICASQSPLLWHFWEIRDRGALFEAQPFSFAETHAYLHLYQRELLTKPLYDLTLGYPLALDTVMAMFDHENRRDCSFAFPVPGSLDQFDLTAATRSLIVESGVGVMRRVEKRLLRQIANVQFADVDPAQIEQWITSALLELKAHKYLESYRKGQPLRFVSPLRHAVEQWQMANHKHSYLSLCTRLAEFYYQRFTQQPITELGAFNEWLFFSATIANLNPQDHYLDMDVWSKRLTNALEQAQQKGERLRPNWFDEVVVAFYRDGELMRRLHTSNLFETVHQSIHALVGDRQLDLPVLNDAETVVYCEQVLGRLVARLPEERREDLEAFRPGGLMKSIAELQPHLDTVSLRNSINTIREVLQQDPLRPGYVSRAVAFLNSRGFFPPSDKHPQSRYQLHRLISKLALLPQENAQ
jgi:hypothetical protein